MSGLTLGGGVRGGGLERPVRRSVPLLLTTRTFASESRPSPKCTRVVAFPLRDAAYHPQKQCAFPCSVPRCRQPTPTRTSNIALTHDPTRRTTLDVLRNPPYRARLHFAGAYRSEKLLYVGRVPVSQRAFFSYVEGSIAETSSTLSADLAAGNFVSICFIPCSNCERPATPPDYRRECGDRRSVLPSHAVRHTRMRDQGR
jgi:hypothetical protein